MSGQPKGGVRPIIIIKRKKKASHGGHHGGAWKVAYADFVTAMMALFIVLWLLTQADMRLKQQLAQFFRNPGIMPGGSSIHTDPKSSKDSSTQMLSKEVTVVQGHVSNGLAITEQHDLEREAGALRNMVEEVAKESPDLAAFRDDINVTVSADGLAVEFIDKEKDLLFDTASTELKPGLVQVLKRMAPILAKLPNNIQVGGHTDARPYHVGNRSNWDLSFERANKARVVLESSGLRAGQMARVLSYADSDPFNAKDPFASENRRLSILALRRNTDKSTLPSPIPEIRQR